MTLSLNATILPVTKAAAKAPAITVETLSLFAAMTSVMSAVYLLVSSLVG